MRWTSIMLMIAAVGTAAADPPKQTKPIKPIKQTKRTKPIKPLNLAIPTPPPADPPGALFTKQPLLQPPTYYSMPSLRLEAVRVAGERFANDNWRYPEPGPVIGVEGGAWFMGVGYYRPRTKRSAALHGGSIAATMVGEILLSANSPLAAVGALATGATFDAAAADSDREAEAGARPLIPPPQNR